MSSFIPYGCQSISNEDISSVVDVLRSPFLTQGPAVPAFEASLARQLEVANAVAVNSATSALHIACLALELGPGDILWTSPITFVASANCGRYCGAEVDFVDIDLATGLICLDALRNKLKSAAANNTLPKVIVVVHLAGSSCPMQEIHALVSPYGIRIIEDASHAIGATYRSKPVGSCQFSDITVFSFHPVKIITTGEGGACTSSCPILTQRLIRLRSHGITKNPDEFLFPPDGPWSYEQQDLGFNYRMTDLQAALGISQLSKLSEFVSKRNIIRCNYENLLRDLPVTLLSIPDFCYSSLHLAIVMLQNKSPGFHRNVFESLRSAGIGVQLHYSPVHLQPYYRRLGFNPGDFPNSELYSRSALSLPIYPGLSPSDQEKVVHKLRESLT